MSRRLRVCIAASVAASTIVLSLPTTRAWAAPGAKGRSSARNESSALVLQCEQDWKIVETAAETFKAQMGVYPASQLPAGESVMPATAPTGVHPDQGDLILMGTGVGFAANERIGPWLRSYPVAAPYFQITFDPPYNPSLSTAKAEAVRTVRGNRIIPKHPTYTFTDCNSLSR